jgi:hypothetical protein
MHKNILKEETVFVDLGIEKAEKLFATGYLHSSLELRLTKKRRTDHVRALAR